MTGSPFTQVLRQAFAPTRHPARNLVSHAHEHAQRTLHVPLSRTRKVLRRTIGVPRRIKTRRAPRPPPPSAIAPKAPRNGRWRTFREAWHSLCVKRCHRINDDPPRAQHRALAAASRSGQRRPLNSVIDWVRGTPFLFSQTLRQMPEDIRRCSKPKHIEDTALMKIIVIGHGMVGHKLVESLAQ